ncbi:hypothetical protein DPMN_128944 [Dreissena polymorpha]|uniref:Uncharacterized protein n=1 Tax=Dreissena polymorpha TaxID=45954 RepID=A0A9D4JWX0_DREPO|nr:hypothetical protein DPMN_128944 [Dreissena polymorpha]
MDVKLQMGAADWGLKTNVVEFQGGHYWPDMTPQRSHVMTCWPLQTFSSRHWLNA